MLNAQITDDIEQTEHDALWFSLKGGEDTPYAPRLRAYSPELF